MANYKSSKDLSVENIILKNYDRFEIAGLKFQVQSRSFFEINGNGKKLPKRLGLNDLSSLCEENGLLFMGGVPVGDLEKVTILLKKLFQIYEKVPKWKKFFHKI